MPSSAVISVSPIFLALILLIFAEYKLINTNLHYSCLSIFPAHRRKSQRRDLVGPELLRLFFIVEEGRKLADPCEAVRITTKRLFDQEIRASLPKTACPPIQTRRVLIQLRRGRCGGAI